MFGVFGVHVMFVLAGVGVCICMWMPMCVNVEARDQHCVFSLGLSPSLFFDTESFPEPEAHGFV